MQLADDVELLDEEMVRCERDPKRYVMLAYPWGEPNTELAQHAGPRDWQAGVLDDIAEQLAQQTGHVIQIAIASGHGVGKSALISWLIDWAMSTRVDTRVVVTANTEKQLLTKTWPELAKWRRLAINGSDFTCTATSLYSADPEHEKNWRADAISWSEHNTEAFAGLHNEGKRLVLLFDEASAIADKVWEVAEGALTDASTEILWIVCGNPTRNTGRFRECFRKFRHRWEKWRIDSRDVEGTNKAQLEKWVEDYGEDSDFVKVRVRGMFPAQGTKQFISEADVDKAYGRHLRTDQYDWAPKIIAVEPSWEGDDEFVIGLRQGLMFRILATYPKNDNDIEMGNIIARLEDEEQADAVIIDAGYGTGIYSYGLTTGRTWLLVWFGSAAYDPAVMNKRAEMWRDMRDWLKAGGAIPTDDILKQDLIGPETVPRLDGKLLLESKKDMKARGVPSPNRGDCLAITFAEPIVKKGHGSGHKRIKNDYDPFAAAVA